MKEKDIIRLLVSEESVYPFLSEHECEIVSICDEKPTNNQTGYVRIVGRQKQYRVELVKFSKV